MIAEMRQHLGGIAPDIAMSASVQPRELARSVWQKMEGENFWGKKIFWKMVRWNR